MLEIRVSLQYNPTARRRILLVAPAHSVASSGSHGYGRGAEHFTHRIDEMGFDGDAAAVIATSSARSQG